MEKVKRTQNNEYILTKEEFKKVQENAYLDGAIAMVDSMRDSILKKAKLEDPELIAAFEKLFAQSKDVLLKTKNNK